MWPTDVIKPSLSSHCFSRCTIKAETGYENIYGKSNLPGNWNECILWTWGDG